MSCPSTFLGPAFVRNLHGPWCRRITGFLLLTAVCLSSVFIRIASAQTYIYGRSDFPVGNSPRAVASGDFNGDGKLDFAVGRHRLEPAGMTGWDFCRQS